jgi:hypothetical protein
VLAPSSFQNRLLTRPEVRFLVFATHLPYAARQPPLASAERDEVDQDAVRDRFEADPLVDGVRRRIGELTSSPWLKPGDSNLLDGLEQ